MESNKFDKRVKEKLDSRIIVPSEDAWNKLSGRLDNETENTNNKNYWWFGLAASLVGILLLVSQFKTNDTDVIDELPKVVAMPMEDLNPDNVENVKQNNIPEQEINNQSVVISNEYNSLDETEFKEQLNSNNSNKIAVEFTEKENTTPQKKKDSERTGLSEKKLTFEEQKIQDVVAQVQSLKEENVNVSEEDIDALLIKAQKEIALNRLSQETEGVVDANALLQSVEQDLDQSFRNKVLHALKASYNSVKTTIAQRNK
ncbi:hypothetical protein [uncultured Algibacter sp.]|uniref:hypothetical protein n=1 Tax=uncultured Algibacter sp. TaxID=298659 RepID=UPI00261BE567|nr:hypothetical protein [uncultured Algibacter sp.]